MFGKELATTLMAKVLSLKRYNGLNYLTAMIHFNRFLFFALLIVFSFNSVGTTVAKPDYKVSTVSYPAGARDVVQEIINVIGLKPRFELRSANIENAAAVIYNGKRYILYNERFLASVNSAVKTDWAGVSIIAHEIGHHLNGHTLSRAGSNPSDELEADEFSGFVLRKMGASLADAQAAVKLLSDVRTSSTHPGKNYRLDAVSKGWYSANEQLFAKGSAAPLNAKPTVRPQSEQRATIKPLESTPKHVKKIYVELEDHVSESKLILSRVHFTKAPKDEFYLTNKLHLVHVTDEGVKILGKLIKTNDEAFPFYFESDMMQPVFVSDQGKLYNKQGQLIGYLG